MKSPAEVLAPARHVLLDFDGPICAVFGATSDRAVADLLRNTLADQAEQLPKDVGGTNDPFDVLRYAATLSPDHAQQIEQQLTDLEIRAVASAPYTPDAREAITAVHETGRTITIVSNNSTPAILAYLRAHDLAPYIAGVIGRTDPSPELLKPHPHLVELAIHARRAEPSDCVLIGDSASDICAANAAGTTVIAYANRSGKLEQFVPLHPGAIIAGMADITTAARSIGRRAGHPSNDT